LYVILLILIGTSDFFIGKAIFYSKKEKIKSLLVFISILIDVGSLIYFKYTGFFNKIRVDIVNLLFNKNLNYNDFGLSVIAPLGISFYIFKTLSYIFDIKRGLIEKPEKNYINYLLFVAFFPNILAGPISKARDLLPQFSKRVQIDDLKLGNGLFLIICGLFKKIIIADVLGNNFVNRVFDTPEFFSNFETIMAAYSYTMQLYFDFSGYTDIVIGIALLLGFSIEVNFNKPFLSKNISEFWRRWHITLSLWLNEYVYQPVVFSLRKYRKIGVVIAVIITFIISGLWHGPAATYVIWGTLHGIAITWDIISVNFRKKLSSIINSKIYDFISIFLTFHFLVLSMVIFKTESVYKTFIIFRKIFSGVELSIIIQWINLYKSVFITIIFALLINFFVPGKFIDKFKSIFTKLSLVMKIIIIFLIVFLIFQFTTIETQPFIYLKF